MSQEFQKQKQKESYDSEKKKPVIRSRMFHGEQAAGFVDLQTGEFTEVMRICSSKDMDDFLKNMIFPLQRSQRNNKIYLQ